MKMVRKLFRYFASDRGRKFVFYGTTGLCITAFGVNYFPHNILIDQYREIIASYQNGVERDVTDGLMKKFEKAANLVKLTAAEREVVEPFMVTGFDLYSIGSTTFRYGAQVGIPVNFTFTAADEIPKAEIKVKGYEQVDWNSEAGKLLQEGIIFTEAEQIFGMAREMLELRTNKHLFNALFATTSIFMYYSISNAINHQQRLFTRPLSLRIVLYTLVGLFSGGFYCFLKDATQVKIDHDIDEQLAQLDEEYVAAGISFYDKVLKKNMAIRKLTGSSQFTATGNLNSYFRTKAIPLNMRKLNFEIYLKNLKARKEELEARS